VQTASKLTILVFKAFWGARTQGIWTDLQNGQIFLFPPIYVIGDKIKSCWRIPGKNERFKHARPQKQEMCSNSAQLHRVALRLFQTTLSVSPTSRVFNIAADLVSRSIRSEWQEAQ
jgi:hypothetical protein